VKKVMTYTGMIYGFEHLLDGGEENRP
jgi:hypothetical protein